MPSVAQVRPGLWVLPLPLPAPPHEVLVYVLQSDAGPYLVDAGWDTEEAWDALRAGLEAIGTRVEDVQGVLVTHSHIDHYGLAPRIRAASGAWVALHPLDAEELPHLRDTFTDHLAALLRRAGAPPAVVEGVLAAGDRGGGFDCPGPDLPLADGARPPVPGWRLTALWTPGHTPGHLCFFEERHRLLLAGDHVLPRTAVGMHPPRDAHDDPLGGYLRSLDRLQALRPQEVLPAHEHRFTDLPARLAELRGGHAERIAAAAGALRDGPATAWEIAGRLRRGGSLNGLRGFPLYAAVSRALTLLAHLRRRGLAEELPGEPPLWSPVGGLRERVPR